MSSPQLSEKPDMESQATKISGLRRLQIQYREELSEFFGTLIMLLFGLGVVAQTVLSKGAAGDSLSIHISWCLAVVFGIYCSAPSGAHLNPSVTIGLAVHGGFAWSKVPRYILAQMLGGVVAGLLVYINYISAFNAYDGGVRTVPQRGDAAAAKIATAGVFATYPADYLNIPGMFFSEFFATMLLFIGILAIGEAKNANAPKSYGPIAVGLLVLVIGCTFGVQTGYAMNPARDFGPRLATFIVGYGSAVFTAYDGYFWVPIVAPVLGAVFGGYVFKLFLHWDEDEAKLVKGE
ncbi:glycerol channel [Blastocladiella emersonii ATCC 22665]|nr:glycerol channel [Blastocladiella emersonii ATCC 22665]